MLTRSTGLVTPFCNRVKKSLVVFVVFLSLLIPLSVFSSDVLTTEDLKTGWDKQETLKHKEEFIKHLLLELEKMDPFHGDTISQFLTDIASRDLWVRNDIAGFRGRSHRLDRWLKYIMICSYQQKMILDWAIAGAGVQFQRAQNNILAIGPLLGEGFTKTVPSLDHLTGALKKSLPDLIPENIFGEDLDPSLTQETIEKLGDVDWHVRDEAEEELIVRDDLNLKNIFFEIHHNQDAEVVWRLWHVAQKNLSSVWEALEHGSIASLSHEDKLFLFEHIFPLGLSGDFRDAPRSYIVIDKLKELAQDSEFSKKILDLLIPYWRAWQVVDYITPLSYIFYTVASQNPSEKPRVIELFKNFYNTKRDSSFDFLWEHQLPYYLVKLEAETKKTLKQKMDVEELLNDVQCFLLGNIAVRLALTDRTLWEDIRAFVLDTTKDKELQIQIIEHLYLKNTSEVQKLLEELASSSDISIQLSAFKNLIQTSLGSSEGIKRFNAFFWKEVALEEGDVWRQRNLLSLYLKTDLVPSMEHITPYLVSAEPLIRSMAFTVFLRQAEKIGQWRTALLAIEYYLPREHHPPIEQLMVDQLTEERWMGKTPSKYVFLENYLEENPNTPFKKQIANFLMQPR